MNKKYYKQFSLQDYVKRLWNHSNTKIPVTIGKGTDTTKPRSKAPHAGQWEIPLATAPGLACVSLRINSYRLPEDSCDLWHNLLWWIASWLFDKSAPSLEH